MEHRFWIARTWDERLADEGDLHGAAMRLAEAARSQESEAAAGDRQAAEPLTAMRAQAEAITSAPYDAAMRKRMRQESFRQRRGR